MIQHSEEGIQEALEFLKRLHPDREWHLTAIEPDGPVVNRSFGVNEREAASTFIRNHIGIRNLYVHVNELRANVRNVKANKASIAAAVYVHVDLDDESGVDRLRAFSIAPTAVVASGGGYNAYWRLSFPLVDLGHAECINRWLVQELGGDRAATDVSRILRIPGTVNLPTRVKRARGRTAVMAHIFTGLTDWTREYAVETFGRLDGEQGSSPPPTVRNRDHAGGITVRELPDALPDRLRQVAVLGDDPEKPRSGPDPRYPSRSEAVFAVACGLARISQAAEDIAGVLLNPEYGVSASVRERRNPSAEALRQAEHALRAVGSGWPNGVHPATGAPVRALQNTQVAILRMELSCRHDLFRNRMSVGGHLLQEYHGDLTDTAVLVVRDIIHKRYRFDPGTEMTRDALVALCAANPFDPICDYLDGVKWDRTPRIGTFLIDYCGAEDTPFVRAVSTILFIAAVRRAREPGVKFDTIPVLEGEQGTGKSSMLKILAGDDFFSDMDILALDQKAQMEVMEGVWIYEIGELAGMRFTDVNKIKAFASRSIDRVRPAYGRFAELRRRRGILVGTTNDDTYLKDESGNRRFWPIATGKVDLEGVRSARDQLWAEASVREASGDSIILPEHLWAAAAIEQARRVPPDAWQDVLADVKGWSFRGREQITTQELLFHLDISNAHADHFKTRRLAKVMRTLGWEGPILLTLKNGDKKKGYRRQTDRPEEENGGI